LDSAPQVAIEPGPAAPAEPLAEPSTAAGAAAVLGSTAGAAAPATGTRAPAAEAAETARAPAAVAPLPAGDTAIEITSVPRGAELKVNGRVIGVTPMHVPLPAGKEARVTVSSPGYAAMTKPIVPGTDVEPLRFRLEPLPYELRVRTVPPDAELSVGSTTAIAPGPLALGHVDGSVQVSVAKPGYQRMTRPVRLDEFHEVDGVMRADIEVRLSPLPGGAAEEPVMRLRPQRRRSPAPPPAPSIPEAAPPEPSEPSEPLPAPIEPPAFEIKAP
jgi:hypothetical protein